MHPVHRIPDVLVRPRPWLGAGLLLLGAALVLSFARREEDFAGYVLVGELALQGRDIYRDAPPGISTWPPLFALLCVPLALLSRLAPYAVRVAWLAANMAALAASLVLLLRCAARGLRDAHDAPVPALSSLFTLLVLFLTSRYVVSNFEHLQVNVLIFLLALGGMVLLGRGRTRWGG